MWFASVLVLHLLCDDPKAKDTLMEVVEGDESSGEEVITCIQAAAGNLVAAIQRGDDERVTVAYLMLLCGWLIESTDAVNDFLNEGSILQILIQTASKGTSSNVLVRGLCAALLGIVYEFSTKDSPIPRRKLQPMLLNGLTRERYTEALAALRQDLRLRDFEVLPQSVSSALEPGAQPEVYFDSTFVELLKDNFSRLTRAIDRDPGLEVHTTPVAVDRDLVDSLRHQIEDRAQALLKVESDHVTLERELSQEQAAHRRDQEQAAAEFNRIKNINEALQREHASELQKLEQEHASKLQSATYQNRLEIERLKAQLQHVQKVAADDANRNKQNHDRELRQLQREKDEAEKKYSNSQTSRDGMIKEIDQLQKSLNGTKQQLDAAQRNLKDVEHRLNAREQEVQELHALRQTLEDSSKQNAEALKNSEDELTKLRAEAADHAAAFKDVDDKLQHAEKEATNLAQKMKDLDGKCREAQAEAEEKELAREAAQTELDDMLMVLADLEEKRKRDRERLKAHGEEISEGEEEDEEGEEEEDEGEGEEDEDEGEDPKVEEAEKADA